MKLAAIALVGLLAGSPSLVAKDLRNELIWIAKRQGEKVVAAFSNESPADVRISYTDEERQVISMTIAPGATKTVSFPGRPIFQVYQRGLNRMWQDRFFTEAREGNERRSLVQASLRHFNFKGVSRYGADLVSVDVATGVITLKGRVWVRIGDKLVDGLGDPDSLLKFDPKSGQVVSDGHIVWTELLE